jgi:hypothetical protein
MSTKREFFNWQSWQQMTKEEYELLIKAEEFEEKYFQDFTLKLYNEIVPDKVIGKIDNISSWEFRIVKENNEFVGRCNGPDKIIEIVQNDDIENILLHEMIHAYEYILLEYPFYHQYVLLKLYEKILSKIPNLIKIIEADKNRYTIEHTPLSLLKSFDIDLELGLPVGTIYSYGREEIYKELQYIK